MGRSKLKNLFTVILFSFTFFSCQLFENDVSDFMEKYTETAAIEKHAYSVATYKDSLNNPNISSEESVTVELYMRNPKRFNMTPSVLFPQLEENFSRNGVEINQLSSDMVILKLPQQFLIPADEGHNISSEISLYEPMSGRTFDKYNLTLYCNSIPPVILNPTVLNNNDSSFVLAFDMPNEEDAAIRHKDLKAVKINGTLYSVTVTTEADTEGILHAVYSFSDPRFTRSWNSSYISINQKDFAHNRNSVYFDTGDAFAAIDKEYTLTLIDEAGLSSTVKASTSITKLLKPVIKDVNGSVISENGVAGIPFDEETETGVITIEPPVQDHKGNAVSGVTVYYKVYEETGSGLIYTSGTTTSSLTLQLPQNTYRVEAYASLTNYETSATSTVKFRFLNNVLFVREGFINGDGSENAPYGTIALALDDINARPDRQSMFTILASGNLNEEVNLSGNINTSYLLIKKNPAYDSANLTAITLNNNLDSDFKFAAEGITISNASGDGILVQGSYQVSLKDVTIENCSQSGITLAAGSQLTLSGGSITGNNNGGINVVSGSILNIEKNPVIQNNTRTVAANVCLAADTKINVIGALTDGCHIGVTTDSSNEPVVVGNKYSFTQGYSTYNTAAPNSYFVSDKGFVILQNGTEAGIALSGTGGNLLTRADEFQMSFAAKEGDDGLTAFGTTPVYRGETYKVIINPTITMANGLSTVPVYYNVEDDELYTSTALTEKILAGEKVNLKISIYNSGVKVADIPAANISSVFGTDTRADIPASAINYNGDYVLRVSTNYLGKSSSFDYSFQCNRTLSAALYYFKVHRSENVNLNLCIEGPISSSEITSLKSQLRASGVNCTINLDLSKTTNSQEPGDYTTQNYMSSVTALQSISFPEWMIYIAPYFCSGCSNLQSVTLPASILSSGTRIGIGDYAFNNCSSLSTINFTGYKAQWLGVFRGTSWRSSVPASQVHCIDGDIGISETNCVGGLESAPTSGTWNISTAAEFNKLRNFYSAENKFNGVTFNLTQNVTLPDNYTLKATNARFNGVLDGNNHTITQYNNTHTDYGHAIISALGDNGVIRNLKLEGESKCGNLVETMFGGLIENVVSNVQVKPDANYSAGSAIMGGLVNSMRYGTIKNCVNKNTVEACSYGSAGSLGVGGIVGEVYNSTPYGQPVLIMNCINRGEVKKGSHSGGIIGRIWAMDCPVRIINCKNHGSISGKSSAAGIAGYITTSTAGTVHAIENCSNHGSVGKTSGVTNRNSGIAGILGIQENQEIILKNNFNSGTITNGSGIMSILLTDLSDDGTTDTDDFISIEPNTDLSAYRISGSVYQYNTATSNLWGIFDASPEVRWSYKRINLPTASENFVMDGCEIDFNAIYNHANYDVSLSTKNGQAALNPDYKSWKVVDDHLEVDLGDLENQ